MYGIVNQSIQDLVVKDFGEVTWLKIIAKSKIDVHDFQNHQVYDDAYTYRLAEAVSEVLQTDINTVFKMFGEFWILEISLKKYPSMMASGGLNFKEFMLNLPNFHNRVYLTYPELVAPEFKVRMDGDSMLVEYHSQRPGLTAMMEGMLHGIVKMFKEQGVLIILETEKINSDLDHDLFRIIWEK
jgi:hypothetical protein